MQMLLNPIKVLFTLFILFIFLNLCDAHVYVCVYGFNIKASLFAFSVLHTEQFPEFHVDWHSVNDVTLYSEYTPTKLMRSVTSKLGFAKSKFRIREYNENIEVFVSLYIVTRIIVFNFKLAATGYRLKRGYKTRTSMEDKPRDIDHLVFVVHGIGQKRDTGKIIRNTTWYIKIISIFM